MAAVENVVGWFCVGFSKEVPVGAVVIAGFFGADVVLYRGESGAIYATEPHCPHLGAHIGHGGTVSGDEVVCPFHGLRFNANGDCTREYQEGKVSNGKLRHHRVIERAEIIFVWNGPDEAFFEFPYVEGEADGWFPHTTYQTTLDAKSYSVIENIIDYGHLGPVHMGNDVEEIDPFTPNGKLATVCYDITMTNRPVYDAIHGKFGFILKYFLKDKLTVRLRLHSTLFGLGLLHAEFQVWNHGFDGWHVRTMVLPTPNKHGVLDYRYAVQFKPPQGESDSIKTRLKYKFLVPFACKENFEEVHQEFPILENLRYNEKPMLAVGDGPIIQYRKWAAQFIGNGSSVVVSS